ncbi:MAG: hypothetical protein V1918_02265 [Planctomycetota bacterium]
MKRNTSRARRLGRILLLLAGGCLPAALGWLLAPLPPLDPGETFLAALPREEYPLTVELRGGGEEFRTLGRTDWFSKLLTGEGTSPPGLRALLAPLQDRSFPGTLRRQAILRLAGHQAAAGVTREDPTNGVAVFRLDNLGYSAAKGLLWWTKGDLTRLLQGGMALGGGLEARFVGRTLVLGRDKGRVEAVASFLGDQGARRQDKERAYPSRALLLRYGSLPGDWPGEFSRLSEGCRNVPEGELLFTREGSELVMESRVRLCFPFLGEESLQKQDPLENVPLVDAPVAARQEGDVLSVAGWVSPNFAWRTLAQVVWGSVEGEDAANEPYDVFLWRMLAEAFASQGDGRFALWLRRSPPLEVVPAAPELLGWIGTAEAVVLHGRMDLCARLAVKLFAAPGGSPLWEKVRQETELEGWEEGETRATTVRLHPLFFHGMNPFWASRRGVEAIGWGTHFSPDAVVRALAPPDAAPPSFLPNGMKNPLAAVRMDWSIPPDEVEKWMTLVMDKADNYGWAKRDSLSSIRAEAEAASRILRILPPGRAELFLHGGEGESAGPEAGAAVFWLDTRAAFGLQDCLPSLRTALGAYGEAQGARTR